MNKDIYEVTRNDYKAFVATIKSEYRDIREEEITDIRKATNIYSKITGTLLCGREYDIKEDGVPEKYYIYTIPSPEESIPPRPVVQVTLETKEEVQKFFDYLSKQEKMKK